MSEQTHEKRAHPRVPYGAWVTLVQDQGKSFYLARNLSLGGVFLRSDMPPPLGTEVDLLIVVEGLRDPIAASANVVRHAEGEGGFAVRFNEMSEDAAAQLLDLVQSVTPAS